MSIEYREGESIRDPVLTRSGRRREEEENRIKVHPPEAKTFEL